MVRIINYGFNLNEYYYPINALITDFNLDNFLVPHNRVLSAIVHIGNNNCGHYTIFVRNNNNEWFHVDDEDHYKKCIPNNLENIYALILESY